MHQFTGLKQQLRLTAQLQNAIKLLAMGRMELAELLQKELLENPLLEELPGSTGSEEVPMTGMENVETLPQQPPEDDEWKKILDEYCDMGPLPSTGIRRNEDLPPFDANLTKGEDLYDHLFWQLQMSRLLEEDREIAAQLIGNLDSNGYLKPETIQIIADALECFPEAVERVRKALLQFDPVGVGAVSIEECLSVQADLYYPDDQLVKKIILNHLKDLVGRNVVGLAKTLGVTAEEVEDARELITALDPKPGRNFSDEGVQYVTPDVYVEKIAGEYMVVLNDDGLPRLRISPYYRRLLDGKLTEETRDYIRRKVKAAVWFLRSIHQRQSTIRMVSESIVKFQKAFLDHGVSFLKPLVLRDVANAIGMHESTISRVTSNKWIHTPQGLFSMKFFFNPKIQSQTGEDLASEAVRNKIKDLVAGEDPKRPLSDSQIVKILDRQGLKIARRTIAKYRALLNILPSSKRVKT